MLNRKNGLINDAKGEQDAYSLHMADVATDSFDRDIALSFLSSEQDALYEIDAALERIRNRTYGICELTGKPIEAKRLEAIPWTRFSAAAEKELEKDGALRRPHLGPRGPVPRSSGTGGNDEFPDEE